MLRNNLSINSLLPGIKTLDLEALLRAYPLLCLIWDRKKKRIVAVDPKLVGYLGLSKEETGHLSISDFIADYDPSLTQMSTRVGLTEQRLESFEVKNQPLGDEGDWILVSLDRKTQVSDSLANSVHWDAIEILTTASQDPDTPQGLEKILRATRLLAEADIAALYITPEDFSGRLELFAIRGEDDILPDFIQKSEFSHLRLPVIWQLGMPTNSELHQLALSAQLSFVATSPVEENGDTFRALLVVGDRHHMPVKDLEARLRAISSAIGENLHLHRTLSNLWQQNQQLEYSLSVYQGLFEEAHEGVLLLDPAKVVITANNAAEILLGYEGGLLVGQSLNRVFSGKEMEEFFSPILDLPPGITYPLGENKIKRRDGSSLLMGFRCTTFPTTNGFPAAALQFVNLAEKQEFETRREQLQQKANIGEMIAVFSHEVKNPINNIRMGLENLTEYASDNDEFRSDISRLVNDIDRVSELMATMLAGFRNREYKMTTLEIQQVLQALVYKWRSKISGQPIEIDLETCDDQVVVNGDRIALEQVFSNVISNGIAAMKPDGGKLSLRQVFEPEQGRVHIDISDTGPGIPADVLDKIFTLYFSTKQDGHGIGLAISKQIVNAHNGQISVKSVPGGTVFRISFPAISRSTKKKERLT